MEAITVTTQFPYPDYIHSLAEWFQKNQRDLPWRWAENARDPYRVLVSEVMLQQTTVKAVIPFYTRFLERFPTVHDLASADIEEVLPLWAGLGYYSRARSLHRCAQVVAEKYDGEFPRELDEVLALPGVGRYTAGAVTSIAFDAKSPIVDANVARVFSRLFLIDGDLKSSANQKLLWEHATAVVESCNWKAAPSIVNPAMMELGALICTPRNPQCDMCPVQSFCGAYREGRQNELPFIPAKREAVELHDVCAFATRITAKGETQVLLRQRAHDEKLWWRGMWELPRTTRAQTETPAEALARLFREELGSEALTVDQKLKTVRHGVTHHDITLDCYRVETTALPNESAGWFTWEAALELALPSVMKRLLEWLRQREKDGQGSLF